MNAASSTRHLAIRESLKSDSTAFTLARCISFNNPQTRKLIHMLRKIQPRLNSGTEGLSGQIIILIDRFVNNQPQHRTRFFAPWSSNSLQSCISSPSRTFRIAPHIIRPSFSETFGISFVRILTPSKVCGLPRSHSTSEIVGVFSGVSRSSINLFVFLAARGVHLLRLVLTGRHAEPG